MLFTLNITFQKVFKWKFYIYHIIFFKISFFNLLIFLGEMVFLYYKTTWDLIKEKIVKKNSPLLISIVGISFITFVFSKINIL
jgi:hypothetical protein